MKKLSCLDDVTNLTGWKPKDPYDVDINDIFDIMNFCCVGQIWIDVPDGEA